MSSGKIRISADQVIVNHRHDGEGETKIRNKGLPYGPSCSFLCHPVSTSRDPSLIRLSNIEAERIVSGKSLFQQHMYSSSSRLSFSGKLLLSSFCRWSEFSRSFIYYLRLWVCEHHKNRLKRSGTRIRNVKTLAADQRRICLQKTIRRGIKDLIQERKSSKELIRWCPHVSIRYMSTNEWHYRPVFRKNMQSVIHKNDVWMKKVRTS